METYERTGLIITEFDKEDVIHHIDDYSFYQSGAARRSL